MKAKKNWQSRIVFAPAKDVIASCMEKVALLNKEAYFTAGASIYLQES